MIDDLDGDASLGFHLLHMETYIQFLFLLEMQNTTLGSNLQLLVRCIDMNVSKEEGRVGTTEKHIEFKWHGKVLQHWRKGA